MKPYSFPYNINKSMRRKQTEELIQVQRQPAVVISNYQQPLQILWQSRLLLAGMELVWNQTSRSSVPVSTLCVHASHMRPRPATNSLR